MSNDSPSQPEKWAWLIWIKQNSTWLAPTVAIVLSAGGLYHAISKATFDREKEIRHAWQSAIVFGIIENTFVNDNKAQKGISVAEIRKQYEIAAHNAVAFREVGLSKDDLSDTALKRVLMDLLEKGLIVQIPPGDRYAIRLDTVNPRLDRINIQNELKFAIIHELTIKPGTTSAELSNFVLDKTGARQEEFNYVLNEMLAFHMIIVTTDSKDPRKKMMLWTAANCPTCGFFNPNETLEPNSKDIPMPDITIPSSLLEAINKSNQKREILEYLYNPTVPLASRMSYLETVRDTLLPGDRKK